ncbi:MAG: non-heme iron oxygenase ferredoxin subunit [Pseudomonadota bacterium]
MFVDACAFDDLPGKGLKCLVVNDVPLVLVRKGDEVHVVANRCSHARATFEGGRVRGNNLMCPLHGATFDIRSGEPTGLPARRPIRVYTARIEDGRVQVDLSEP